MACDDCGKGIDVTSPVNGVDAPTISNVNVNADNTLTFTLSDGSVITTSAAITFNQNNLAYVYSKSFDQASTSKSFQIAADEFDTNGDTIQIVVNGNLDIDPGAADLVLTFNGDVHNIYITAEDISGGGNFILRGEIFRIDSTTIAFQYNLRILNIENILDPNFNFGNAWDEIDGYVTSTADFTEPITVTIGQSGATISRFHTYLIKND